MLSFLSEFEILDRKILNLAEEAAELGIELLVMDDGWFKGRNTDTTSLGDWVEDKTKFPDGLQNLAKRVKQKGIEFGIWFEPEMISEKSDLYRTHSVPPFFFLSPDLMYYNVYILSSVVIPVIIMRCNMV